MATKRKQAGGKKLWTKAKWKGFVNLRLNSQEKEAIKNIDWKPEDTSQFFEDAATAGYKVSLSYSIPEDVFTASLTGMYVQKPNPGMTISIRHRDVDRAVAALHWAASMDDWSIDWEERFGEVDSVFW